jgi:uncharacterized protein (DUF1697 family)
MIYTALLRGINVGGNSKVEMSRLKIVFEELGCTDVTTYINSGNVIFKDDREAGALIPLIEKGIEDTFSLSIRVILRDCDNVAMICKKVPASWKNNSDLKTDVIFLWDEINDKGILNQIKIKPELEQVLYVPGALIWTIERVNATKGSTVKLIGTDIYKHMTIRSINTVRKLNELMAAIA